MTVKTRVLRSSLYYRVTAENFVAGPVIASSTLRGYVQGPFEARGRIVSLMRILVVSDIHGNLEALQTVLASAGLIDATWNLGDTVGYGPNPRECVQLIQNLEPEINLAGNHDLASTGALSVAQFNPTAKAAAVWTQDRLSAMDRAYLEALPATRRTGETLFAHGSPRDPVWEYVDDDRTAGAIFREFTFDHCYVGHTHQAIVARFDDATERTKLMPLGAGTRLSLTDSRLLINPGSVGQPRDGDPRAAYGIVDTERSTFTVHRVPYNVGVTQDKILNAGLPPPLAARLGIGR